MEIEFTLHAKEQIKERNLKIDEIINAIKNPDKVDYEYGKYYSQKDVGRGVIEIIYEKDKYIKVITIYWLKIK